MMNFKNVESGLRRYQRTLVDIKRIELSAAEDARLKELLQGLIKRAQKGESDQNLLPETFSAVSEAVTRIMGITPHDVQLISACAMAEGRIVELPTGEGKTLAAVFVACLGALSGNGVHVLTFNDYLAKRDALWMRPVYDFLGFSVSFIQEGMGIQERKKAYSADITYLTAKEAGFDYLRGFLAYDLGSVVQRPFHLAIVDEADSILIDEARIPLVIAGDKPTCTQIDKKIFQAVSSLKEELHYRTDTPANAIFLTAAGIALLEEQLGLSNLYNKENIAQQTKINVYLQALFLFKKDIDYVVRDGKIELVDEFTGRIANNRSWPDDLQAAIEHKEGRISKADNIVLNRITLQHFFQLYPKLCGMTGTAKSSAPEFYAFYRKPVTVVPPHRPSIRIDHPDRIFETKKAKYEAIVKEVRKIYETGRPVLIGTSSIEESEFLAAILLQYLPEVSVLNAKNDAKEAEIIANAGLPDAVTISTNMAGRGVDIRLGGLDEEKHKRICSLGGLYVIGTNRYVNDRIANQLKGRAGRQGDPGESRFFISLEDDLMVKFRLSDNIPQKYLVCGKDGSLNSSAINRAIAHIARVAEGQTLDARIALFKYSSVMEEQRKLVHQKRLEILTGTASFPFIRNLSTDKLRGILAQVSQEELLRAQKAIALYSINQCWADHLLFIESALDEVQVLSQIREDSYLIYCHKLSAAFDTLEKQISEMIVETFYRVILTEGHIDLTAMGIHQPSSTKTYLVNDGTEQLNLINGLAASSNPLSALLFGFYLFIVYLSRLLKNRK